MKKLAERTALITGGSRGIGRAIALAFAAEGCDIAFCHVGDVEQAAQTCEHIQHYGQQAISIDCDVSDEQAVNAMVSRVTHDLGHIDIVVNCAGISGDNSFESLTVAQWDRMINVHLRGTFLVTHACYPAMMERGWGRIINIASQLAYKGAPRLTHYCAAKAGIIGFTRALAYEGAPHGVLVNAIAPGPVDTDLLKVLSEEWRQMKLAQLPLKRFGKPEEIAPTALLLASEDGSFYVGQTLSPNGGDVML
jgi:3-oxoacyl-[acyl-carrier protein] reductase